MKIAKIQYRPATEGDREWLWALKSATMRDYVAAIWGWEDEAQRRMFDEKFDPARIRIIQADGREVGLLDYEERTDDFFIGRIEILPTAQRAGIGSAVIAAILHQAAKKTKNVRLQVLRSNPARRLYERLGFCVEAETSTHIKMKKKPGVSV